MATAPAVRTTPKPAATAAASATAAAKPTAVKGTPGRKPGSAALGPVLSWTDARREALIDVYRDGATSSGEIAAGLAKHPAFKGVADRITTTKIRNQWAGLQKKFERKGYTLPDLERSGNGEPVDVDALWARLQGGEGSADVGGEVDEDGNGEAEGEFEDD